MNHCVPDCSIQNDSRPEDELVELLWQNGHVVMHSQAQRKTMTTPSETKQCQKPEPVLKGGELFKNSVNIVQEETSSWLQYSLDDSLENEFCQEFFYELATTESTATHKLPSAEGDKFAKRKTPERTGMFAGSVFEQSDIPMFAEKLMPSQSEFTAPLPHITNINTSGNRNFIHFSRPQKNDSAPPTGPLWERSLGNQFQAEAGESSSMMTKESCICASNQVHAQSGPGSGTGTKVASAKGLKEDAPTVLTYDRANKHMNETINTSSSGGSGCTVGRTGQRSASTRIHKRKGRGGEESEFQSEDADYASTETNRQSQRSASARRRRAAEVHNLSERKRRDKINEKMRALQELIPHCNKSDKASMLDEAIEYLKSLQLQVQVMWMRSGMTPMMFAGVHPFMSQIGMGMGMTHSSIPSIHGSIQLPRLPLVKQPVPSNPNINQVPFCPDISPFNFQNQLQNAHVPASYARYLGFQHMQPSPQMMNFYAYGAQLMQQNQAALADGNRAPCVGDTSHENIKNNSTG